MSFFAGFIFKRLNCTVCVLTAKASERLFFSGCIFWGGELRAQ